VAVPPQKFAERSRAPSVGSFRAGARYLGRSYLVLPYTYIFPHTFPHIHFPTCIHFLTYIFPHTFSHIHTLSLHTFSTYKCMYVTLNSIHTYILEKICMCRIHTCMYAKCSQTFAHIHLYVRHWSKRCKIANIVSFQMLPNDFRYLRKQCKIAKTVSWSPALCHTLLSVFFKCTTL